MIAIDKAIRTAMAQAGIRSVRALARAAGVSEPYLGRVLLGKSDPSLATLEKLAGACGVPVSRMLGWGEG